MKLPLEKPPTSLCLLRLSAVGDICHTLPIVRTIQHAWPETKITWIIGKLEYSLVNDIPDIDFVVFDKKKGLAAYLEIAKQLKSRRFDILLHMQMSLRASLVSLLVRAKIRLGFDKKRSNDLQWLFTNHKIPFVAQQHVMDSFFGFSKSLGIHEHLLKWDIPISDEVLNSILPLLPDSPFMVVSPCSSMSYRNWGVEGYARVIDYVKEKYAISTVLTGGPGEFERRIAADIVSCCNSKPLNLAGKTQLKQLLAIIARARFIISPDSGPAHMATSVATPVIGLYAATNPARARPYMSEAWLVNRYPDAIRKKFNLPVESVPWGTRVKDNGTMDLIKVSDVIPVIDRLVTNK